MREIYQRILTAAKDRTKNAHALRQCVASTLIKSAARVPSWAHSVAEALSEKLGEEYEPHVLRDNVWVDFEDVEGYADDAYRIFPSKRERDAYIIKALAKEIQLKPKKYRSELVIDMPESFIDYQAQDAAHGYTDSMSDSELELMSGGDPDEARESLWESQYEETREDIEADPIGWLNSNGWDVSRGKLPLSVSIDFKATAKKLLEENGADYYLQHSREKPLKIKGYKLFKYNPSDVYRNLRI